MTGFLSPASRLALAKIKEAVRIKSKVERHDSLAAIGDEILAVLLPEFDGRDKEIKGVLDAWNMNWYVSI